MNQNAEYYFRVALQNLRNSDGDGALDALDKAIQLDPQNPKYYLKRGSLTGDSEEYSFGLADFTKVIVTSKDLNELKEAYLGRALAHEHLGHVEELLHDISWLIEHESSNATHYGWRGTYEERTKQFESALADFNRAYQLSPTRENLLKRARTYYSLEQYTEALQDFTQIISSEDPHFNDIANVYRWRGSVYYKLGNMLAALADFNEQLRLQHERPVNTALEYIEKFGLSK